MWGLKMQVFDSQKVLAVGQTSGSGGWVKKISLDYVEGEWLSIAFGNQKKQWQIRALSSEGANSNSKAQLVFPRAGKEPLGLWMCGCPACENF